MKDVLRKLLTKGYVSQLVEVTLTDNAWASISDLLDFEYVSSIVNNFAGWTSCPQGCGYWRDIHQNEVREEDECERR